MASHPIKGITPPQAWDILQSSPDAALFDVRTRMEYEYVGHPVSAINIPWKEPPDWVVSPDFTNKVKAVLTARKNTGEDIESVPVLTICRSGKRSFAAAEELVRQGFKNVYNVDEGFEGDLDGKKHRSTINGWRHRNLPWEQS